LAGSLAPLPRVPSSSRNGASATWRALISGGARWRGPRALSGAGGRLKLDQSETGWIAQHNEPAHQVLELANVAGEVVRQKALMCVDDRTR
jgi:hypothetical protein